MYFETFFNLVTNKEASLNVFRIKRRSHRRRFDDGFTSTLVCYEKFERIETSQFLLCFTKHDYL